MSTLEGAVNPIITLAYERARQAKPGGATAEPDDYDEL